jgi:hypothetical protein
LILGRVDFYFSKEKRHKSHRSSSIPVK